jgi:predicted  nucleic acid-binding Zn-ribbon protein
MPHQCLKCGSVFPDGSPQILRGCPDCGGTKFFFTENSMSDEERSQLQEKAKKDIKNLIQEMMVNDSIPIKVKEKSLKKDEWVYLGSTDDAKTEKGDIKSQKEVEKKIIKSIEDLKFPKEGKLKRFKFSSKGEKEKKPKAAKKPQKDATKVKAKTPEKAPSKTQVKKKTKKKKEDSVAVINITDEGVYELDVEALMDHSPIIVQKDGSYMVHLPSVFKGKNKGSAI